MEQLGSGTSPLGLRTWSYFLLGTITTLMTTPLIYSAESTVTTIIHSSNNTTDHLALLAFKAEIIDDPNHILSSWSDSTQFCSWAGVTCSTTHPQRAKALVLPEHRLVGSLSAHVGNLSFLTRLNLSFNNFRGGIPDELGRLRRLRYLSLFSNSFYGELPKNLTQCSKLTLVDLAINNLLGSIPSELGALPRLRILALGENNFSGLVPPSLGNLTSLTALDLGENNLEGSIIDDLGRLTSLNLLILGQNKLTGMMHSFVYNLSSSAVLDLTSLHLHGTLPPDLGLALPNLTELELSDNLFTGTVPLSLSNATKLEILSLATNVIAGHVAIDFGKLRSLRWLALSHNQLTGDLNFVTFLTNCTNLETLDIAANEFSDMLPKSIANLSSQLQILVMGRNKIYGSIPRGIEKLSNLQVVDMADSLLSGTIDIHFRELWNLESIYLSKTKLSGEIPDIFANLTHLSVLLLDANDLEGVIPLSLEKCQFLQYVYLSNNKLNGSIPPQIFSIPSLVGVDISKNSLFGQLALITNNLSQILYVNVSHNKLFGEIPDALADCLNLRELKLGGNLFQGGIPSSFGALKALRLLDLSNNNLSGRIPQFFEKLRDLEYLNLSLNNFEGEVPRHGIFENVSAFSVFGNNKLCGGVLQLLLSACPNHSTHRRRHLSLRIAISCAVFVAFSLSIFVCLLAIRNRVKKSNNSMQNTTNDLKDPFLDVTYAELFKGTGEFSSSNLIGAGSFGSVYKGFIDRTNATVAIKVLNLNQQRAFKSFIDECKALRSIQHRNIVQILTVCSSVDFGGHDFKALVFEYMPNGSLDSWLHQNVNGEHEARCLSLTQRISIAIDIVSALDYLHNHCHEQVIHCDLKPSNVLLDNDMVAHVSDFGLARVLSEDAAMLSPTITSSLLKGSIGYVAPEYGMGCQVSIYGDVYSCGVLLLEMFSGKRPTDEMFKGDFSLHEYAKRASPEEVMDFVDLQLIFKDDEMTKLCNTQNSIEVKGRLQEVLVSLFKLGVSCSTKSPKERMATTYIIIELQRVRNLYHGLLNWEDETDKA